MYTTKVHSRTKKCFRVFAAEDVIHVYYKSLNRNYVCCSKNSVEPVNTLRHLDLFCSTIMHICHYIFHVVRLIIWHDVHADVNSDAQSGQSARHAILYIIIHTGLLVTKIKSCIPRDLWGGQYFFNIAQAIFLNIARTLCDQSFNIDLRLRYNVCRKNS